MEVTNEGLWIERVTKPRFHKSLSSKRKSCTYQTSAGHRQFIKFDSNFWMRYNHIKTG